MLQDLEIPAKQILRSNILLIICCAFYLVWWLLAFKPAGAIKGIKTGWLLIPASIAGLAAVIVAVKCILSVSVKNALFSGKMLLWGGIAAYLILLTVTVLFFKRQVTTELFLIIGWAVLALSEINILYGLGLISHVSAIIFIAVIIFAMFMSLVCYILYYNLGALAGYIDGMIPLLAAALIMTAVSAAIMISLK